jgi:phage protein D
MATPIVTLDQESLQQGAFYVPQFQLRIEGVGLPRDVLRDITEITYTDNVKEIDSFEMTVNNWDPTTRDFKYVGSETAASLQQNTQQSQLQHLFEPCGKSADLLMGYGGNLVVMLTGNFTTMEPNFTSGGPPTLTVRGLNVLNKLRTKQFTTAWVGKKPSEIAENIATLRDPSNGNAKRFPLPIVTDPNAKGGEQPLDYEAQSNQYDIDFLLNLARQNGYVVFVLEADPTASSNDIKSQKRLFFGPSQGGQGAGLRQVTFNLEWGKSLLEFKPTLTVANQIKSVTVNGWNRQTNQPIAATVTIDDPKLQLNKDLHSLITEKCDAREEVVVDEPVFTPGQARQRAIAILSDRQKEMVKASGTSIGLADLRAGQRVLIGGLGARFSGTYFITDTTHTIGDSGYTTQFNARREDNGTGTS